MTTFYEALPRESDKRYDMTARSGSMPAHPIGYCAGWSEENPWRKSELVTSTDYAENMAAMWEQEQAKRLPFKDKYHTDGHATPAEAITCWRQWGVDQRLTFQMLPDEQRKCAECETWTQGVATFTGVFAYRGPIFLCLPHQTQEIVLKHLDRH